MNRRLLFSLIALAGFGLSAPVQAQETTASPSVALEAPASLEAAPVQLEAEQPAAPKPTRELTLPPAVENAEAQQLADAIILKIFPPSRQEASITIRVNGLVAQMRANAMRATANAGPGLRKEINAYFDTLPAKFRPVEERNIPIMTAALAKTYTKIFSVDELREINKFGETPAGARYLLNAQAAFNGPDVQAANAIYSREGQAVAQKANAELTKLANVYLANHPDQRPKKPAPGAGR